MLNLSSPFVECLHWRLKLSVPRPGPEMARSAAVETGGFEI
ncbi:rCG57990 [Rattus norvegicus]|uniref:RCG57990 n=1 Tax=Rattus norvegicus TaxID=10116 RepID=A6J4S4_RAT|nr:rCG57990 [Rattus norvegicus]